MESVLSFWFGDVDDRWLADDAHQDMWFSKSEEVDREIRERFLDEHAAVTAGEREDWLTTARGRLAYVIVLDQFSRNMFRDTPQMFAADGQALAAAQVGIDRGEDRMLGIDGRSFLYMPLMHAEDLATQDRCVALFSSFQAELTGDLADRVGHSLKFAILHRDIIARFGRFPHRNEILGRKSSPEELAFLETPGSSF